jgi:para-aminobenzoate synthetase/4-amino-4-deoxychorismate lyase
VSRDVPLSELFRALFPPASVTGAPKIRAAAIIRELEGAARGVYCGAVGVVRPGGDATFNVAIRTAWATRDTGLLHLNAGGGITTDSTVRGELSEVAAKLAAFTQPGDRPALFETIRVEKGTFNRLERHLARLAASAEYFDIPFDRSAAMKALDAALARAERADVARARLDLDPSGALVASIRHDPSLRALPSPARVALAATPVDRNDVRLYHKGADRARFDSELSAAPGMFDVLLWNTDGEATEFTRGNLVAQLDGRLVTPPVDCGLLAGTLRAELLERGDISERVLTISDVWRAERLWFVNSLRGWVAVRLEQSEVSGAS